MNVLVFDIETIPDLDGGRRLYGLDGLDDADVGRAMQARRQAQTGNDFLPLHLQRVVAISAVLRRADTLTVWSLGNLDSTEAELIQRFYDGIERYAPTLVSWNGGSFDLPVLHYRSLIHGLSALRYWDVGGGDRDARYNNYLGRFHWRHIDLMDVLALYQPRAAAPLTEIAMLCGLPGKLGLSGAQVWDTYLAGDIDAIRNYCETDALNTYLLYLRFERLRGNLDAASAAREHALLSERLAADNKPHLREFLSAWNDALTVAE